MQAKNQRFKYNNITPYNKTESCFHCSNVCKKQLFCVALSRFHVALAKLGKTPLNETERALLAPNDGDGGSHIKNHNIRNTIFLYEQTELNNDDVWESLARLLEYPNPTIPHDKRHSSHGKQRVNKTVNTLNICDEEYDRFRMIMMPYAYEMSQWICDYFVESPDVIVANRTRFCATVRAYANDPCGRLVRLPNGTYVLSEYARISESRVLWDI
jgi:hypothetical protein